jgi:hypothetical protein
MVGAIHGVGEEPDEKVHEKAENNLDDVPARNVTKKHCQKLVTHSARPWSRPIPLIPTNSISHHVDLFAKPFAPSTPFQNNCRRREQPRDLGVNERVAPA